MLGKGNYKDFIFVVVLGVGRRDGQVKDIAAERGGVRVIHLIPLGSGRRGDADVQLLAEVAPLPDLRPQVPHPGIVERQHDGRP